MNGYGLWCKVHKMWVKREDVDRMNNIDFDCNFKCKMVWKRHNTGLEFN